MTQDRLFKLQVRRLAELNGLSYTEAKKQLRSILNAQFMFTPGLTLPSPTAPKLLDNARIFLGSGLSKDSELDKFVKREHRVIWIPAVEPHILLTGYTGSGKTVFANSLVETLNDSWTVLPIDASRVEWKNGAHSFTEALEVIDFALDTMNARYSQLLAEDRHSIDSTDQDNNRILIVLDGMATFDSSDSRFNECIEKLSQILRMGRAAGVHILEVAQSRSVFSHAQQHNFALNISMLNKSEAESRGIEWSRGIALLARFGFEDAVFQVAPGK